MAHSIKITIQNFESPVIWRTLSMPENATFHELHQAIMVCMRWGGGHLYSFFLNRIYSNPSITIPEDEEPSPFSRVEVISSITTPIKTFLNSEKKTMNYVYDFGDDWVLSVKLMKKPKEDVLYPICTAGEGFYPMEDCGGPYGMQDYLDILQSGSKEEKKELKEWLGLKGNEKYEVLFAFDMDDVNEDLKYMFSPESPAW